MLLRKLHKVPIGLLIRLSIGLPGRLPGRLPRCLLASLPTGLLAGLSSERGKVCVESHNCSSLWRAKTNAMLVTQTVDIAP